MSLETKVSPVELDVGAEKQKSLTPADWDARLVIARAKREKALAQQANSPKKKRVNRPPILFDTEDLETAKTAFFDDEGAPEEDLPEIEEQSKATLTVGVPDTEISKKKRLLVPIAPVAALVKAPKKSGFSQFGLILVSCSVGLGFGFAAGLGLLIGSGWVTPQQFAWPTTKTVNETSEPVVIAAVTPANSVPTPEVRPEPPVLITAIPNIADTGIVDTGPVYSTTTSTLQTVQVPQPNSSFSKITSIQRSTIAPLPLQMKSDLTLARKDLLATTRPAGIWGAFAPPTLEWSEPAQTVSHPPSAELKYATSARAPEKLATPFPADAAFNSPEGMALQAIFQDNVEHLATPESVISSPNLQIANMELVSFSRSPAQLLSATGRWQTPEADQPSIRLNFAQSMGLSIEAAKNFDLMLFAPETVEEANLTDLSGTLSETGLPLSNIQRVNFTISKPHIRYYSTEGKDIAVPLAKTLGMDVRDFVASGRGSDRIEVWMSGKSVRKPNVKVTKRRKRPSQTSTRSRLSNSIISGLRNATN